MKANVTRSRASRWVGFERFTVLCLPALLVCASASAASPTAGNLLVTVNEFTGSNTAPTYIAEYTTSGSRAQMLGNVPIPGGGAGPTTEQARDLVLGPDGAVYLYNGTFTPYLARLDMGSSSWAQLTFDTGEWVGTGLLM